MWKMATLVLVGILVLVGTGKFAYDRGYSRGQFVGRVDMTKTFTDAPEKFLLEAQVWCTANMVEGYTSIGLWKASDEGARRKLFETAEDDCRQKVHESALRLVDKPK